jgi:hypothetical protein
VGSLLAGSLTSVIVGRSAINAATNTEYVPRLGDIMNAVQARHIKLSFAGKSLNWDLAAYELAQLRASLIEAAVLYSGSPVSNVTTMAAQVDTISGAIEARDSKRFSKTVGELTQACNACHKSMDRGYIVMRVVPVVNPILLPVDRESDDVAARCQSGAD